MVEKLFNNKLFERQKLILSVFFFIYLFFSFFPFKKETSKYSIKDLKVDVNKTSKEELTQVPYIGIKTAEKILQIRKKYRKITNWEQLKNLKNFKKFRKFLKIKDF